VLHKFTTDEVQQLVKKRRLAGINNTSTQYDFLCKHLVVSCMTLVLWLNLPSPH
jgi:hypothetical protein